MDRQTDATKCIISNYTWLKSVTEESPLEMLVYGLNVNPVAKQREQDPLEQSEAYSDMQLWPL